MDIMKIWNFQPTKGFQGRSEACRNLANEFSGCGQKTNKKTEAETPE